MKNTNLDSLPAIWEQREQLSYTDLNITENSELLKQIVDSTIDNVSMSWNKLTLEEEAYIQKLLRDRGYNLLCYNLSEFPTSAASMQLYLEKASKFEYIKKQFLKFRRKVVELIDQNDNILFLAITVYGLFYYQFESWWIPLISGWLVPSIILIITHDGWVHNYLEYRNKYIGWVLDLVGYLFSTFKLNELHYKEKLSVIHYYHHKYHQTDNDIISDILKQNHILKFMFTWGNLKLSPHVQELYLVQGKNEFQKIQKFDKFNVMMENHTKKIVGLTHVLLWWALGTQYYLYLVLVPIVTYSLCFTKLIEYTVYCCQHNNRDMPWAYPLVFSSAYHISHHECKGKFVIGPAPWRYLNPQYWFVRLFYRIKTEIV